MATRTAHYAAFLRGVSPMNAKMPELKRAFAAAGFSEVRTFLSSGNVSFVAGKQSLASLERKAEAAMEEHLGRSFVTFVRPIAILEELLASDPWAPFELEPGSKRIVTFLREPPAPTPTLPIEFDGARILHVSGTEVFSAYVPSPRGPAFMALLEKTFGKLNTTRTLETVKKVVR